MTLWVETLADGPVAVVVTVQTDCVLEVNVMSKPELVLAVTFRVPPLEYLTFIG